jgi:glycosyltransferase involved in cell wall biosynthesis
VSDERAENRTEDRLIAVFVVARYLPPHVGGVERQMELLAGELRGRRAVVECWTTTGNAEMPEGVVVHRRPPWCQPMPLYLVWLALSLAAARLRLRRIPVVMVSARTSAESAAVTLVSAALRAPTIVFVTGGDERGSEFATQRRGWVRRLLLHHTSAFVAHADLFVDELRRLGFEGRTEVIRTITPSSTPTLCPWEDARSPNGSSRLVWCGRDDPVKNLGALERLCGGALWEKGVHDVLLVCDREPSVSIAGATVHTGCRSPRSHFRPGDVLVLTSLYEGQSNALAEAALEGVPVVAYGTGGTPEIVSALDGGEVLPLESSDDAFAQAVARVARRFDPEARARLRARAQTMFSEEAGSAWISLIRQVATGVKSCAA